VVGDLFPPRSVLDDGKCRGRRHSSSRPENVGAVGVAPEREDGFVLEEEGTCLRTAGADSSAARRWRAQAIFV
jgi:hypothetical protein